MLIYDAQIVNSVCTKTNVVTMMCDECISENTTIL